MLRIHKLDTDEQYEHLENAQRYIENTIESLSYMDGWKNHIIDLGSVKDEVEDRMRELEPVLAKKAEQQRRQEWAKYHAMVL